MIVLIDGYNFLKQIYPGIKGCLEISRDIFIKNVGQYKKHKKGITEIVVVFDAGPFSHAIREIKHGVCIIFSGQKSSADDWIVHYTFKHKEREIAVVSRDKALLDACNKKNTTGIDVFEFYKIMQETLSNDGILIEKKNIHDVLQKYDGFEDNSGSRNVEGEQFDDLMKIYSSNEKLLKLKDDTEKIDDRKTKRNKLSKKNRQKNKKMRKL
jgi:predicted RNA-binding protein with PIN domain